MAVSVFWLALLRRLGLAHRDGHCYWFFTGIDHRGGNGVRRVDDSDFAVIWIPAIRQGTTNVPVVFSSCDEAGDCHLLRCHGIIIKS